MSDHAYKTYHYALFMVIMFLLAVMVSMVIFKYVPWVWLKALLLFVFTSVHTFLIFLLTDKMLGGE